MLKQLSELTSSFVSLTVILEYIDLYLARFYGALKPALLCYIYCILTHLAA